MTNAEKFEQVFGIKIDGLASDLCDIVDHGICINNTSCNRCPLFHFWKKRYKEKKNTKGDKNES